MGFVSIRRLAGVVVLTAALVGAVGPAMAVPLEASLRGTTQDTNFGDPTVPQGTGFTLTFTYEREAAVTTTPDWPELDWLPGALLAFSLVFDNGVAWSASAGDAGLRNQTENGVTCPLLAPLWCLELLGDGDLLHLELPTLDASSPLSTFVPTRMRIRLYDWNDDPNGPPTMLGSTSLRDLRTGEVQWMEVELFGGGKWRSISLTPEPGGAVLAAAALVAFLTIRRAHDLPKKSG